VRLIEALAVYRRFTQAEHQTCVAHLLRRCREMMAVARPGEAKLPRTVKAILQHSLPRRERRDHNQMDERGLALARGRLEARLDRTLNRNYRSAAKRPSANHLCRQRNAIFTFLSCPGREASYYRAQQAIPPMLVTGKVGGGNRTAHGAHAQSVLLSILRTCRQPCRSAAAFIQQLLHLPKPQALQLITPSTR